MRTSDLDSDPALGPEDFDYGHPEGPCDIVMKGGITSGVVYPHAVCALASRYRFRSVGGTSAGAIAAAAAAAAELGRHSEAGGFQRLAAQPEWLGSGTRLFDLFQPQESTRGIYRSVTAGLGADSRAGAATRFVAESARRFPGWALLGAVPGIVVLVVLALSGSVRWPWLVVASTLVIAVAGALFGAVFGLGSAFVRKVADNNFGLCSGIADEPVAGTPALTTWLADLLDALAGRPTDGAPLTFLDLWRGPDRTGSYRSRVVDLNMLTTNLTQGTPHLLPLEAGRWFFDEGELRALFPDRVVDHLVAKAEGALHWTNERERDIAKREWPRIYRLLMQRAGLLPLPTPEDLPVVVATRLSLSFPILLSAIPLHAVDFTRDENKRTKPEWSKWIRSHRDDWPAVGGDPLAASDAPDQTLAATRCWFSDGGITSNFPLPLFDGPIPRWPTFGINLTPFPPGDAEGVWMPKDNTGGITAEFRSLDRPDGSRSLVAFGRAIADTMQNWADNSQTRVPGYRDRIAHVRHHEYEGGLNLRMRPEQIEALSQRGLQAGRMLVDRFSPSPPDDVVLTWDNHRWVRFRSLVGQLEAELEKLNSSWDWAGEGTQGRRSYGKLLEDAIEEAPSYPLTERQRDLAKHILDLLRRVPEAERTYDTSLQRGAPRPTPELKVRPRL